MLVWWRGPWAYRREVATRDQMGRLAEFQREGVRTIEIRLEPDACLNCRAASDSGRHPITFPPILPVALCRRPECRCTYAPVPPAKAV